MDVFSLRSSLVDQNASFARSFTTIRAPDIRAQVSAAYESGSFWPDPLIQIKPRYKSGRSVKDLVGELTKLFRVRTRPGGYLGACVRNRSKENRPAGRRD